jgi:hypothetical protein
MTGQFGGRIGACERWLVAQVERGVQVLTGFGEESAQRLRELGDVACAQDRPGRVDEEPAAVSGGIGRTIRPALRGRFTRSRSLTRRIEVPAPHATPRVTHQYILPTP